MRILALFACTLLLNGCSRDTSYADTQSSRDSDVVESQRICSVSLAGDEWLSILVSTERVVCVSAFADDETMSNVVGHYPESIMRLTGRLEPVLAREPDLVLAAPWNESRFLEILRQSGIESLVLDDVRSFEEIRKQLVDLAEALDARAAAAPHLEEFDARLAAIDERAQTMQERPRVLSFSHLIVAGENTSVDALIKRAGGVNAAAELGLSGHKKVSQEQLVALDPDVLLLGFGEDLSIEQIVSAYPQLRSMSAVRENRVVLLAPKRLTTVTHFLLEGAETLQDELSQILARGDAP